MGEDMIDMTALERLNLASKILKDMERLWKDSYMDRHVYLKMRYEKDELAMEVGRLPKR